MKIYLAIPYTGIEEKSFEIANKVAGELIKEGHVVFSPISMCHPIAVTCGLPTEYKYWREFDYAYLKFCDKLIVVTLDGWRDSMGVTKEIQIAKDLLKPIDFINPEEKGDPK